MDNIKQIVFIVGVGAPANLYIEYFDSLRKTFPHANLHVLEWWSQDDFGFSQLQKYIGHSNIMLISHSAGSVIALQALAKWPNLIKKIIMLDSHFLKFQGDLPIIRAMLDIMLANDNLSIKTKVESAYIPLIDNDHVFKKAFRYAVNWVNTNFEQACNLLADMPAHSVCYIRFTNSHYQLLDSADKNVLLAMWSKYNVDVNFCLMGHFDFIEHHYAETINDLITNWLVSYDK